MWSHFFVIITPRSTITQLGSTRYSSIFGPNICLKIITLRQGYLICPIGLCCRIHRLHLCRGVRPSPNKCLRYDSKQSNGEVPVMLEIWGIQSTPSLTSLPGPLCPRVVAPDRVLSIGQIELNCGLMLN